MIEAKIAKPFYGCAITERSRAEAKGLLISKRLLTIPEFVRSLSEMENYDDYDEDYEDNSTGAGADDYQARIIWVCPLGIYIS